MQGGRSVRIKELSERRIVLRLEGFSLALANSIRRIVLSDVPTMAVDFTYIYDNTTPVYDEMISHRMGLLVLKSDEALGRYRPPEECAGKEPGEAENCYTTLELEASVDQSSPGRYVKAEELRPEDPEVTPVHPETPIAFLGPGQRLHLKAYARLGRGREHSKWSPASVAVLRHTPVVAYDSSRVSEECMECLGAYPQVLEAVSRGGSGELVLEGLRRTSGLRYCSEGPCRGALEVRYDSRVLELEIEGTGALRPERIVAEASRILEEKVKRFAELVKSAGVVEE